MLRRFSSEESIVNGELQNTLPGHSIQCGRHSIHCSVFCYYRHCFCRDPARVRESLFVVDDILLEVPPFPVEVIVYTTPELLEKNVTSLKRSAAKNTSVLLYKYQENQCAVLWNSLVGWRVLVLRLAPPKPIITGCEHYYSENNKKYLHPFTKKVSPDNTPKDDTNQQ